jgi:hypothetical protein
MEFPFGVHMASENKPKSVEKKRRRDFIKTATKFAGVLGVLGVTAGSFEEIVSAQEVTQEGQASDARVVARNELLVDAINTGDMESAIRKHKSKAELNTEQVKALRSLTRKDLAAFKSIRSKLIKANLDLGLVSAQTIPIVGTRT